MGDLLHTLHATLQMEYFQRNSKRAISNKRLERLVIKPPGLSIIPRDRGFANRKHTSTPVSQTKTLPSGKWAATTDFRRLRGNS